MRINNIKCLILLSFVWNCPAIAQSSSVQNILDSYISELGPPKFICGVGLNRRFSTPQPSPIETETLEKLRQHGTNAIPVLVQNLSSNHSDFRMKDICERALSQIGPNAVPSLVSLLQHSQGDISNRSVSAATKIIKCSDPTSRQQAIVTLLNTTGSSQATCWSAVAEITHAGGSRNLDAPDHDGDLLARYALHFANGLNSNDEIMRRASAKMLANCASKISSQETSTKVALLLAKYLDSRINQSNDELSSSVANSISYLHFPPPNEAIKTLDKCAKSPNKYLAESSIGALIFLASRFPQVNLDGVLNLLSGNDEHRIYAISRLRLLSNRHDEVVPHLIKIGNNPSNCSSKELIILCTTLSSFGKEAIAAIPMLIKLLDHPNTQVQKSACDVLFRIGPAANQALPALTNLCKNTKVREVYDEADRAIKRISK